MEPTMEEWIHHAPFLTWATKMLVQVYSHGGNLDTDDRLVRFIEEIGPYLPEGFVPQPLPVIQLQALRDVVAADYNSVH
jgi:hypothetical protein